MATDQSRDRSGLFDWLPRAVDFAERMRSERTDGTLGHADLGLAVAVLMLAYEDGHKPPRPTGVTPLSPG
jgi:hypothetical protein